MPIVRLWSGLDETKRRRRLRMTKLLSALMWQTAFILLLVLCGLPSLAWFVGGMALMFWCIVWVLAQKVGER